MYVNALSLQNKLMGNFEYILQILEALHIEGIKEHDKYISFMNRDGDNGAARVIYVDTLKYMNFTRGHNGNIFTLVMDEKGLRFPQAVQWIAKITGIKNVDLPEIKLPFGGFYKHLYRRNRDTSVGAKTYDEASLPPPTSLSKRFVDDGIPLLTQEKWGVRYSHEDDAVLIPIYGYDGSLVGCKARNNDPNCPMDKRWWAYLSYSKTQFLYGWCENYKYIQQKQTVILVEAEKSVMILDGWDCHLGLAIGGHSFSRTQVRYIKSLMPKRIIVAFDQGLPEEEVIYETKKLKYKNSFIDCKVGYIFDEKGDVLSSDGKDAPVDVGKTKFLTLMKNYITWI